MRHYEVKTGPGKAGRPSKIAPSTALGLLLTFYRDTASNLVLARMFGLSQTSTARVLCKAEGALLSALKTMDEASVRWPTLEEQHLYAEAVSNRHPYV